jgi:hypothetical protein
VPTAPKNVSSIPSSLNAVKFEQAYRYFWYSTRFPPPDT